MTAAKRVLITGASGFVGSHIAERFVDAGYQVRCALRTSSSRRWLEHLAVEECSLDLSTSELDKLRAAVRGVDIVVHAAGTTHERSLADYRAVNTDGTALLAEAARCEDVRRFVYLSSLAARGPDLPSPAMEEGDRPASPYGVSKLEAEHKLREGSDVLEVVVLRPPAVYGPRDRRGLPIFRLAKAGLVPTPRGAGMLQFAFVSDLANATLAAATTTAGFGPFEVAEAVRYSWSELTQTMGLALGRPVRSLALPRAMFTSAGWMVEGLASLKGAVPEFDLRRARDIANFSYTCDPRPAAEVLGWRARVALPEGIARTVAWYREQGWL